MIINKPTRARFGLVFSGLMIIAFIGIALMVVFIEEMAESRFITSTLPQVFPSIRQVWQDSKGNEFTGDVTALLFGASCFPVGVDLATRALNRYLPMSDNFKGSIQRINKFQRKYLMRLHTYLSILALGIGTLHLFLSVCAANPFPEIGLILSGILVATGLLFKWKVISNKLRKTLYKFHTSLIVSGILLVILYTGHAIMGLD